MESTALTGLYGRTRSLTARCRIVARLSRTIATVVGDRLDAESLVNIARMCSMTRCRSGCTQPPRESADRPDGQILRPVRSPYGVADVHRAQQIERGASVIDEGDVRVIRGGNGINNYHHRRDGFASEQSHQTGTAARPSHSRTVARVRPPVARQSCPSAAPAGQ